MSLRPVPGSGPSASIEDIMSDAYRQQTRNAVLVKDDVGKAKPTIYDLPHEGHAYGRSEPPDLEGAREVTMYWAAHVPRPHVGPVCQDFRKINKTAAKSGVVNAKQLADWRKGTDIKLIPPGPAGCLPKVIPSDVIPSFAYGRKSRPSTPIAAVVGNQYAAESEEMLDAIYRAHADKNGMPNAKTKIKLTRAASVRIVGSRQARALSECPEYKEPFKLTKFKKVPSKLQLAPLIKSSSVPNIRPGEQEYLQ